MPVLSELRRGVKEIGQCHSAVSFVCIANKDKAHLVIAESVGNTPFPIFHTWGSQQTNETLLTIITPLNFNKKIKIENNGKIQ